LFEGVTLQGCLRAAAMLDSLVDHPEIEWRRVAVAGISCGGPLPEAGPRDEA